MYRISATPLHPSRPSGEDNAGTGAREKLSYSPARLIQRQRVVLSTPSSSAAFVRFPLLRLRVSRMAFLVGTGREAGGVSLSEAEMREGGRCFTSISLPRQRITICSTWLMSSRTLPGYE